MTELEFAIGEVEELQAVLMLEYHNKNWLFHGTNPAILNREQRILCNQILFRLKKVEASNSAAGKNEKVSLPDGEPNTPQPKIEIPLIGDRLIANGISQKKTGRILNELRDESQLRASA